MINIAKAPLELNSRRFYLGLALALGLHLFLISLPIAFWVDMNLYKAWSIDMVQQGFANFYNYSTNCDYPPAYLYVLWVIGKIYQFFDPSFSHTDGLLLTILIKIPPVLADIASAFLIAQILKAHTSVDKAYTMGLIYAFNPLILFVSAVWGQVDGIMTLLMLWAFYLIQQNHVVRAGLLIAVMVIVKPQGLFFAPFLVLSQWFRQTWWKWGAITAGGVVAIWLIILPFYEVGSTAVVGMINPFLSLYKLLRATADYYSFASVNAFNFWGWANWIRDYTTFAGFSYKVIGLCLLGILLGWLAIFLYQQRHHQAQFAGQCLALSTMLFGFFMLPTRMHERYMLYGLAFLAIAIALIPAVKWLYWGLTLTGAVNVGYAYLRYNYEDLFYAIPEIWLQSVVYITSAINVTLFALMLFHTFRMFRQQSQQSQQSLLSVPLTSEGSR